MGLLICLYLGFTFSIGDSLEYSFLKCCIGKSGKIMEWHLLDNHPYISNSVVIQAK